MISTSKTSAGSGRLSGLRGLLGALALGVAVSAGLASAPVQAQSSQDGSQGQAQSMTYSEQEVRTFAKATIAVEEVAEKWRPAVEGAADQSEAQAARQQAMSEMAVAIRDEGMEPETYNAIIKAAQANPELAQSIRQHRAALGAEG